MARNLTSINVRGMMDPGRAGCLLGELSNLDVETHIICMNDFQVSEKNNVVLLAFGKSHSTGVLLAS